MGKFEMHQLVNDLFTSNTYVLLEKTSKCVWLIDIGDFSKVKELLTPGFRVKGCFITHSHFDHIYGLNELVEYFPDCIVHVSQEGKHGLFSSKLNFSLYHEYPFVFQGGNVKILEDGCNMKLQDNLFLDVISTPGHAEGCLCYKVGDYLFTGDSYIPGVKTVTKLRGGCRLDNERSLLKIKDQLSAYTTICPGHGTVIRGEDCLLDLLGNFT